MRLAVLQAAHDFACERDTYRRGLTLSNTALRFSCRTSTAGRHPASSGEVAAVASHQLGTSRTSPPRIYCVSSLRGATVSVSDIESSLLRDREVAVLPRCEEMDCSHSLGGDSTEGTLIVVITEGRQLLCFARSCLFDECLFLLVSRSRKSQLDESFS